MRASPTRRLIVLWVLGALLLFKPWVHGTDPAGYFSWLRSAVVDGDLDTTNEFVHYGRDALGIVFPGPTGHNRNPYAVGCALLWAPFYLTAHAVSALAGLPRDGYGPAYVVAASLGSALYALAGLWLVLVVARELCGAPAALWATVGIWWATPLLFYMYAHPLMSHANDFFANALFVSVWHRTRAGAGHAPAPSRRAWLAVGGALGLAALVRLQNALLVVVPLVEAATRRRAARGVGLARAVTAALLCAAAALVVFVPQLVVWRRTYGALLPGSPYDVYGQSFDFRSPHFLHVLLASAHGLFVWSPLVAVAVYGLLVRLPRVDRTLAAALAAAWLAQVYLVGSFSSWAAGASFGQRYMIGSTPAFVLGLAALLARAPTRRRRALGVVIGCGVAWSLLLLAQYVVELVPRGGPVDLGALVANQLRVVGVVLERLESLLAARFETPA